MPRPRTDDVPFLTASAVEFVVSLTEDLPDGLDAKHFGVAHIPIVDFEPPTLDQQIRFVHLVAAQLDQGVSVAVHCTAGLGRTGTMLATWFVSEGMEPAAAIEHVRALRPHSIETAAQEAQVHVYWAYLHQY